MNAIGLGFFNITLALINVSRELSGLIQYWSHKVIHLKEKKSR